MRRVLALTALAGLCLAGLVQPAAGQTATPPRITAIRPACAPLNQRLTVAVSGTSDFGDFGALAVYGVDGKQIGEGSWSYRDENREWSGTVAFLPAVNGYYRIQANGRQESSNNVFFSAPCRNPRVTLSPTCSTPGRSQTLTVSAFDFAPNDTGEVYYDWDGKSGGQSRIRIRIDSNGNFSTSASSGQAPFTVTPPNRAVPIHVNDQRGNVVDVPWSPCPAETSPTTSPSTTERPTTPGSVPTTTSTTLEVVDPPGPSVTVPPAVELPPETPGAMLIVSPKLGPTGFVTGAAGTGFPPGPVELAWEPGIGRTTTVVGPDGRFSVRVLVLPNDRIGSRALVATAGGTTAFDTFLVVPSTVQPSGQDVAQINRIRRFNSR